jgi:HSP20 family molecular chaperone IbpA
MYLNKFRHPIFKSTLLISALALSSLASAKTIEKSFDADEGDTLTVVTDAGSIRVETHNKEEIEVFAEIDGRNEDDFEVTFNQTSNGLKIRGEKEGNGWRNWNLRVKFVVTVPKDYNVDLDTAGGSISVDDLNGNVDVETSGGSIKMGNINGDVDAHTSGGSIRTEDIDGNVNAHTSGGSIKVTMTKQITESASLTTSGGSVTANLIDDIKVDIDASTSGGRVHSDFDVDGVKRKRSIKGEINGGGPKLKLRTSGGSVHINSI